MRWRLYFLTCAVLFGGTALGSIAINPEVSASPSIKTSSRMPEAATPSPTETKKPVDIIGLASWYSRQDPGIRPRTANNERFDDTQLTAAMWGVPFHKKVRVTNLENGRSVVVRINDRGPHPRYVRRGRIIDLTKTAFSRIADPKKGLIRVALEFL